MNVSDYDVYDIYDEDEKYDTQTERVRKGPRSKAKSKDLKKDVLSARRKNKLRHQQEIDTLENLYQE